MNFPQQKHDINLFISIFKNESIVEVFSNQHGAKFKRIQVPIYDPPYLRKYDMNYHTDTSRQNHGQITGKS